MSGPRLAGRCEEEQRARLLERQKLAVIEQALADARAAIERARVKAGDRFCKGPILDLALRVQALDLELLKAIDRLHD